MELVEIAFYKTSSIQIKLLHISEANPQLIMELLLQFLQIYCIPQIQNAKAVPLYPFITSPTVALNLLNCLFLYLLIVVSLFTLHILQLRCFKH
jgi:hypothetical protein